MGVTTRGGAIWDHLGLATQGLFMKNFGLWGGLGSGQAGCPDSFAAGKNQETP